MHTPPQQSAADVHATPIGRHAGAVHRPITHEFGAQQSALVVQTPATGRHIGGGGAHMPALHTPAQQSALLVQREPVATHTGVHTSAPIALRAHTRLQHCALDSQDAPSAAHTELGGNPHRDVSRMHTPQQPLPLPELHDSPGGRQSVRPMNSTS